MDFWHDSAVQKRWLLRLTLFIGLLLVPVFVLAVFARPSADDYIYAARTHAVMQQAARISDKTAFFLLGELVEMGPTERVFATPVDKRTEDYISGRFG